MLALENPHCGVSGVPFMNKTTGAELTALSIAARVSAERYLKATGENRGGANLEAKAGVGRAACRNAYKIPSAQHSTAQHSTVYFRSSPIEAAAYRRNRF
jgi:hypothetical protein